MGKRRAAGVNWLGWLAGGVLILSACGTAFGSPVAIIDHNGYLTGDAIFNNGHVVGVVENQGRNNLEHIRIEVSFQDEAGMTLNTGEGYASVDILRPGESSPFWIMEGIDEEVVGYEVKVVDWDETEAQPYEGLVILDQRGEIDGVLGWYHIYGQYLNTGTEEAHFTEVIATCLDSGGQVVGVGSVGQAVLMPGETAEYDLTVWPTVTAEDIVECRLQVSCERTSP